MNPEPHSRLRRFHEALSSRPRTVLFVFAVAMVLLLFAGRGAGERLSLARFEAPGAASALVAQRLEKEFRDGSANMVLLVSARVGTVDDPDIAVRGLALAGELATMPGVVMTDAYWSHRVGDTLASVDRRHALVLARVSGSATESRRTLAELSPRFTRDEAMLSVRVGGREEVFRQVGEQSRADTLRAEMYALPLLLGLLVLVFRGVLAALVPVAIALLSIVGTNAVLKGLAAFTEVSVFAAQIATVLGLGLGTDYGLFMLSRFREEIWDSASLKEAVSRTVSTAGRTVLFSALTVVVSLLGLLAFPFDFLRSFAFGGITVTFFAVLGAVVALPALLAVAGGRFVGRRRSAFGVAWAARSMRFWATIAAAVVRRPLWWGGCALAALLLMASPLASLQIGAPDDRILPPHASSRQVQQVIRDSFQAEEADAIQVLMGPVGPSVRADAIAAYAAVLSKTAGVALVRSAAGAFRDGKGVEQSQAEASRFAGAHSQWLQVVPRSDRLAADPEGLVRDLRSVPSPVPVLIGGEPVVMADFQTTLLHRVPWVVGFVVAASWVALFAMTGSVLLPVKAVVLNLLSLCVTFGALVFVFQQGHFSNLLGFTPTGVLELSIPILVFCIAYGLSMDYEVLMLARVQEVYARTGDTVHAVVEGVGGTAPLITAAALLMAIAFGAFMTAGVVFPQMIGLGLTLAVLVDATLVRAVLAPALMRLAGTANWWSPIGSRRFSRRSSGISPLSTEKEFP